METQGNTQSSVQNDSPGIAGKFGTATTNILDAAKDASKQVGAVARSEAYGLKRELDDLISRIPTLSGAALDEAKEEFLSKMNATRDAAKGISENVRQQISRRAEDTAAYVKEQPLRSMSMAVGVGIILGLLMANRGGGRGSD
ncbi:YqjD family protein [Cupriavidus sp. CuC1]|uniref:YqjD family protein n=1 Tax=Cupriavidus sp. CuC1 TaxID=3373131 RepID=UPI0037D4A4E7